MTVFLWNGEEQRRVKSGGFEVWSMFKRVKRIDGSFHGEDVLLNQKVVPDH